ncbi:tRNA1(Val) (adenine(37)-N6)-methyltransferase [Pontibacter sp. SGAir0037]|uniref:tRNA1(Val) (adenine(37)-N6)-methyltransferase n=1 Tax=Pontibacter sp. SGAir0037 TaxID=2571030 RepID=UPI0010CCC137|nr:methyltransferase [Pontibacter sp. SGAir0037]QCR20933.1 methyltransferase [Pontibacter sp. SGAir0037]
MPNSYFQFKQFKVEQESCAMKVCTDSCLFGAYIDVAQAKRILDIGAGTGLLSLMAAQRSSALVEAVEINPEAQVQATENFAGSPWPDRLKLIPASLQEYAQHSQQQYDVILSNPPFFLSSLKSDNSARNTAKHTGDLLFEDILSFAQEHLAPAGRLYLLLPPSEAEHFAKLATYHLLYLQETLAVYTSIGGKCIRHIQTYSATPATSPAIKQIAIREKDKTTYTADFTELLRNYYLIF